MVFGQMLSNLATPDNGDHIIRFYTEPKKMTDCGDVKDERTAFQRDRDRILYSKAFRRLIHKTQVCFIGEFNEHIRTRLTHTLEVAQISRSICRQVNANEDFAEAIALGHDVGHTPFGHTGENTLALFLDGKDDRINKIYDFKENEFKIGFKHNFQSVRNLIELERLHKGYYGLNLTTLALEGILKHTKIVNKNTNQKIIYENISDEKRLFIDQHFSVTLEGQIVSLSDEIAQICHDLEDVMITNSKTVNLILFELNAILNEDLFEGLDRENEDYIGKDNEKYFIKKECFKPFISWLTGKIILLAVKRIKENMKNYREKHPYVDKWEPITSEIATENAIFNKDPLFIRLKNIEKSFILNNFLINRMDGKATFIIRRLIKAYLTNPKQLTDYILKKYGNSCTIPELKKELAKVPENNIRFLPPSIWEENKKIIIHDPAFVRLICDYISFMTDVFALQEYQKLYSGDRLVE